jgi:hypothetical protein
VKINGIEFCGDEERMGKVAREFAMKSNFVINGCIGAIDGWIVKIKKPSRTKELFTIVILHHTSVEKVSLGSTSRPLLTATNEFYSTT